MKIDVTNLQNIVPVSNRAVRRAARAALHDLAGCYSIVLVDNEIIRDVNLRYLGRNRTTDVIAFPFEGAPLTEDDCAGEILVSVELAAAEARKRGLDVEAEITLYVVHGALHLAGFDDLDPEHAAPMHTREKEILADLGYDVSRLWKPLNPRRKPAKP